MRQPSALVTVLVALCAAQAGWLGASWLGVTASAEEPKDATYDMMGAGSTGDDLGAYPGRLRCQAFVTDLPGTAITIPGGDTPAGRWVRQNQSDWQPYTVNLVTAQKPTGYPQGWLHVCLSPR